MGAKAKKAIELKQQGHSVQQIARIMNEAPFLVGQWVNGSK